MNYRLQLSPISGTRESKIGVTSRVRWESPSSNWENAKFFRSWFIYDSDLEPDSTKGRINWNMVLGLGLTVVVSLGFWTGVGLMVASFWK
jgi:hypothetical protein